MMAAWSPEWSTLCVIFLPKKPDYQIYMTTVAELRHVWGHCFPLIIHASLCEHFYVPPALAAAGKLMMHTCDWEVSIHVTANHSVTFLRKGSCVAPKRGNDVIAE